MKCFCKGHIECYLNCNDAESNTEPVMKHATPALGLINIKNAANLNNNLFWLVEAYLLQTVSIGLIIGLWELTGCGNFRVVGTALEAKPFFHYNDL